MTELERMVEAAKEGELLVEVVSGSIPQPVVERFIEALSAMNQAHGGKGYIVAHRDTRESSVGNVARMLLLPPGRSFLRRVRDALGWQFYRHGWPTRINVTTHAGER